MNFKTSVILLSAGASGVVMAALSAAPSSGLRVVTQISDGQVQVPPTPNFTMGPSTTAQAPASSVSAPGCAGTTTVTMTKVITATVAQGNCPGTSAPPASGGVPPVPATTQAVPSGNGGASTPVQPSAAKSSEGLPSTYGGNTGAVTGTGAASTGAASTGAASTGNTKQTGTSASAVTSQTTAVIPSNGATGTRTSAELSALIAVACAVAFF